VPGEGQVSITQPVHKVWTVNEGGKLIIVCTSPLGGSVDWLHNDVPIATSIGRNRFTMRTVAVGNTLRHYLTVKDVRQQDAGRYTCRQTYSDHRHINVSRLNGQLAARPRAACRKKTIYGWVNTGWGAAAPISRRRRRRDGWRMGRGPPPQPTMGSGETGGVMSSHSRVRGGSPATNAFSEQFECHETL